MSAAWPTVPLGDLLRRSDRTVLLHPEMTYKEVTVRLNGKGVIERRQVQGVEIASDKRYEAAAGQFIISRIDARHGASGIIPDELDRAVVTNDFPLFNVAKDKLDPAFLNWMSKTASFVDLCKRASEGTTNRVRLSEDRFKALKIALPPLDEQRRIVMRIEELAKKIQAAHSLREQAKEETQRLLSSVLSQFFDYGSHESLPRGWRWLSLNNLLEDRRDGMITGPFGTLLSKADVRTEGIPILGIANVHANRFVPGFKDFVDSEKARELAYYELRENDIVIARSGTVGRSCIVPSELVPNPLMSTNLMRLRLDKTKFLPKLLCMLFNGSKLVEQHKESECRGSTRTFFTQKILLRLRIPTPPISEQHQIASELDCLQERIGAIKTLQSETAAELDAILPAIFDKAFKGEL